MNDERLINELTDFTIRNYTAKGKGRSTWGTPEQVKEFHKQKLPQTIIKRNDEGQIETVATYCIEEVNGKNYFVFLTFASENKKYSSVCFMRKFCREIYKNFGLDGVGFFNYNLEIKWIL